MTYASFESTKRFWELVTDLDLPRLELPWEPIAPDRKTPFWYKITGGEKVFKDDIAHLRSDDIMIRQFPALDATTLLQWEWLLKERRDRHYDYALQLRGWPGEWEVCHRDSDQYDNFNTVTLAGREEGEHLAQVLVDYSIKLMERES